MDATAFVFTGAAGITAMLKYEQVNCPPED